MQQAIEAALEGVRTGQGGPFGAVVIKGGEVIAAACNRVLSAKDPTAHAEIEAIRAACAKLGSFRHEGCELYATCEPCPMCLAAACWARLDSVVYACDRSDAARAGFDDALLYQELEKPPSERKLALVPFLRDEALKTFQAWIDKPDRVTY